MSELSAADLAVVIPTRDRWDILRRTLASLASQTVTGFTVIVVVDGEDQTVPALGDTTVVVKRHGGPGAARNRGVTAGDRKLVLFLGDDMIPDTDLVERHLAIHRAHPEPEVAVLGKVEWHPEVRRTAAIEWMDRSNTQFDYPLLEGLAGQDVGLGRFFSCNVSLKRSLFDDAGGFDPAFIFYYEDLDLGWRLSQKGMRLLYEPGALTRHLHQYDWPAVVRRFEGIALGERLMQAKHTWFEPWFLRRIRAALDQPRPLPGIVTVADRLPARPGRLRALAQAQADRAVHRRLAQPFLRAWDRAGDVCELMAYTGADYDPSLLIHHESEVDAEADRATDETEFYRTSRAYLYDLTVFSMSGTKDPYLAELRRHMPSRARVLDYGCGIGADGLRLVESGHQVSFADFANPSTEYLRWRLSRRGAEAPVFDIERDVIPDGFDVAYSFDVIEHVEDPFDFLSRLESRARVVAVNLLEPDPNDTHLHRPLPIAAIRQRAVERGLLFYRVYYGRSHLLIYRGTPADAASSIRSRAALLRGRAASRLAATRR